jgi:soluble lytic murein transglycosylase
LQRFFLLFLSLFLFDSKFGFFKVLVYGGRVQLLMMRWFPLLVLLVLVGMMGYFVIPFRPEALDTHRYDSLFAEAGKKYEVDPALVKAVAWQESHLNPDAKGGVGELGLMQLTDMASFEWADSEGIKTFTPAHLTHPRTNALAGAFYLSKMLKRYQDKDRPVVYALADYNAGRKAVLGWMEEAGATNSVVFLEQMDYPGTKAYIRSILEYHHDFHSDFNEVPPRPLEQSVSSDSLASLDGQVNRPNAAVVSAD